MGADLISGQKIKARRNSLQIMNLFLVMTPPSLKSFKFQFFIFQDEKLEIIVSLNSTQFQEDQESRMWVSCSLTPGWLLVVSSWYLVWGFSRTHSIFTMLAVGLSAPVRISSKTWHFLSQEICNVCPQFQLKGQDRGIKRKRLAWWPQFQFES